MYRHSDSKWVKHWDFILLDLILILLAYSLSCFLRDPDLLSKRLYRENAICIVLLHIAIAFFTDGYQGIVRRGYAKEMKAVFQHVLLLLGGELLFLFLTQRALPYSRSVFILFFFFGVPFLYIERVVWKWYLKKRNRGALQRRSMLLVVSRENAERVLRTVQENLLHENCISGIILADEDATGETIGSVPVVASLENAIAYIQKNWADEIFIRLPKQIELPEEFYDKCEQMGLTIHRALSHVDVPGRPRVVQKLGGYMVASDSINIVTTRQVFAKRLVDIVVSIIGLLFTFVLSIVIVPMILIASPGPVIFAQERIGKGGKHFKMYKFRSMYPDAEARKAALMAQNEMKGPMFKVTADPRIIGSGPDGTKKGIGWFLRTTSIDELPQLWNVLKGDMSLVGTRPPTVDEWEQYEPHHRARLAARPGITGLWQVSGRSDIEDFEEIVRMDTAYIREWNLTLDLRILCQTVAVVLKRRGAK